MRSRLVEGFLWTCTAAAAALAIVGFRGASHVQQPPRTVGWMVAPPAFTGFDPDSLAEAASDAVDGNLFRPSRAPVDSTPAPSAVRPQSPVVQPHPHLVLRGILGGPPWDAVIEGIPGRAGSTVVRAGETISGLTIRSVLRDAVVIQGLDTTWKLLLGRL